MMLSPLATPLGAFWLAACDAEADELVENELITEEEAGLREPTLRGPSRCVVGADVERKPEVSGRAGQLTRRRACILVKIEVYNGIGGTG